MHPYHIFVHDSSRENIVEEQDLNIQNYAITFEVYNESKQDTVFPTEGLKKMLPLCLTPHIGNIWDLKLVKQFHAWTRNKPQQ